MLVGRSGTILVQYFSGVRIYSQVLVNIIPHAVFVYTLRGRLFPAVCLGWALLQLDAG